MVKIRCALFVTIATVALFFAQATSAASDETEPVFVSADACDDINPDDSASAAENRAIDNASLLAVKLSGEIQKHHPNLSSNALDLISYRIIDEYMFDVVHKQTFKDDSHICVKLSATVLISQDQLEDLVTEYQKSQAFATDVPAVAAEVQANTSFKPLNLKQKKLLYIKKTELWNGEETNHYHELMQDMIADSKYYFLTDDIDLADYTITPQLLRAEVDEIDISHHKMQIHIRLRFSATRDADFESIDEEQTHFILFAANKDEQQVADSLIRKLLTAAAQKIKPKIEQYLAKQLEKQALQ